MGQRRRESDRPRAVPVLQPDLRDAPRRACGVPALRLRAVSDRADPGVRRRAAVPDQRPGAPVRAHRLHGRLQHVGAAGGFHQLRLHRARIADRPADRGQTLRRSRRAAARALL